MEGEAELEIPRRSAVARGLIVSLEGKAWHRVLESLKLLSRAQTLSKNPLFEDTQKGDC